MEKLRKELQTQGKWVQGQPPPEGPDRMTRGGGTPTPQNQASEKRVTFATHSQTIHEIPYMEDDEETRFVLAAWADDNGHEEELEELMGSDLHTHVVTAYGGTGRMTGQATLHGSMHGFHST